MFPLSIIGCQNCDAVLRFAAVYGPEQVNPLADKKNKKASNGAASSTAGSKSADNKPPKAKKIGRPSTKTEAITNAICERIACGETLTAICKEPGMPGYETVWRWRQKDSAFDQLYMRARVAQMERWADEIVEISDDTSSDVITKTTPQGREYDAFDTDHINRSRLRVDTRKFLMAKIAPHLYGERVEVEHTGTVEHDHSHEVSLTDKESVRRFALFMLEDQQANNLIEGESEEMPALQPINRANL